MFPCPFSPTAIALGCSAIVTGFGAELLSDSLWFSGADPSWAAPRFHQGSANATPRLHRGFTEVLRLRKFRDLSGLLSWADPFWGAKSFCGRFPHHFFKLVSQFLNSFLHFSPAALALGSSAIVKVLGQNGTFVLGFLAANGFRLPKGSLECSPNTSLRWSHSLLRFFGQMAVALRRVPPTILYICLTVSRGILGKWVLLQKRFCGGFRQPFFTFICLPNGCCVKVAQIVDMSHPYKSSPQKTTHHVVAVGVFFGLIFTTQPPLKTVLVLGAGAGDVLSACALPQCGGGCRRSVETFGTTPWCGWGGEASGRMHGAPALR